MLCHAAATREWPRRGRPFCAPGVILWVQFPRASGHLASIAGTQHVPLRSDARLHLHCKLMCTCTHTPLCASIGMWHHTGVHTLLWNRCFVKVAHMRHSQGFNSHPSSSFECFDRETKCVSRRNLNVCAAQARTQCQRRHGLVIRSNLPTSLQPYSM